MLTLKCQKLRHKTVEGIRTSLVGVVCEAGKKKQRKSDLLLDFQQRGHQRTSSQSGVVRSASPPSAPAVLRLSVTKHGFC